MPGGFLAVIPELLTCSTVPGKEPGAVPVMAGVI
jgi:hypothetical protein